MNRTKWTKSILLTLVAGFALTLGAGVVVGMAAGRHEGSTPQKFVTPQPPPPPQKLPSIEKQLGLDPEQSKQVKAIWSELQSTFQKRNERRAALLKERDDAFYNLLNDGQKLQYQKLMADYSTRLNELGAELGKERDKAFHDAVERTKKILTEPQRQKYDQLLKEHGPPGHRGEHGEHGEHGDRPPDFPRGDFRQHNRGPGPPPDHGPLYLPGYGPQWPDGQRPEGHMSEGRGDEPRGEPRIQSTPPPPPPSSQPVQPTSQSAGGGS